MVGWGTSEGCLRGGSKGAQNDQIWLKMCHDNGFQPFLFSPSDSNLYNMSRVNVHLVEMS